MGDRATANDEQTTVRIYADTRDILKIAAVRRGVTMAALLDELIVPLADGPAPRRRAGRDRKRGRSLSA